MSSLEKLCKKVERFSINALNKEDETILKQIEQLEKNNFLTSILVVRCYECGSDLGLYQNQEEMFCPMCMKETYVLNEMIERTFFITGKGKKFFRDS